MRPESTNGTSGGRLTVPMAWLCAEYIADEMLRTGELVESGSLEYRAGRQTLALTVYLCNATEGLAGATAVARIDEWLALTSYGHPWQEWVDDRLAAREARQLREPGGGADPDLALASAAWKWLRTTELLATDLGDGDRPWPSHGLGHPLGMTGPFEAGVDESARIWTPAWRLGLPLSHLAIHLF
ncbi:MULTISPECIES: hypothetical protein [Streptomyces]|uniref:Uncharacterized protein n=1 Tax=Streptomyces chengmaiensis TaxID=3040919 RepID=A0ABT6HJD6_9ACTN|nr:MULTISPECIES: hypothetical protein [Streptomyces]MDH2387994.1 hypothetical protein [Streptomyces chengmaiensis]WRQ79911.1 hypothetical protein I3F59_011430 [Streptomyces sp. MUM 178J]